MRIKTTFCGRRFRSMLFTASISVCAEIINLLIDKIVAAHFLGEKALAAISFFTPLFSVVLFVSAVVMVGSLVCYSIEIGKLRKERADQFFGQSIILSVGSGILMAVLFAVFRMFLQKSASLDPELFRFVDEFYTWFIWLAFLIPVNNVLQEMVYADGDTRTCNLSYALLLLGNVAFSVGLCQVMGLKGVALGTFLSLILSIAALCTHFARKSNTLKFVWHFKWREIKLVFRYSMAEACEFLMFALFSSVMNIYFIQKFGLGPLPILSMVYEILELSVLFNGVWMAAEPLVNTYRAEENDKGIMRTMRFVFETASKEAVLASVLAFVFAPVVVSIFHIQSHELSDAAVFAVRAAAIGFLPMAITKIFANYHVHENPLLSFVFIVLVICAMPLACSVFLGAFVGEKAFWIGFGVAPFAAMAACVVAQLAMYGKQRFPLLLEHTDQFPDWMITDMKLSPESLMQFWNSVNGLMEQRDVCDKTRLRILLLIEELGMAIYQRNNGKAVYVEFSLAFRPDHVILTCKDDGVILDLTDLEQSVTDLRIYLINMFMTVHREKQYLWTINYNRHVFKFEC